MFTTPAPILAHGLSVGSCWCPTQRQSGGTSSCGVGQTYPAAPSLLPRPSRNALRQSLSQPKEPCGRHTPENKSHPEAERKRFDQKLWDFLRWAPSTACPSNDWESNRSPKPVHSPAVRGVLTASLTLSPPRDPPPSRGS